MVHSSRRALLSPLREASPVAEKYKTPPKDPLYLRLDANKLHNALGRYGTYQLLCYTLCQLLNFFYAGPILVMAIIQDVPKFTCSNITEGVLIPDASDQCSLMIELSNTKVTCGKFESTALLLNSSEDENLTMLREFGLLCTHPILQQLAHIIYFLGAMLIVPIASHLSDLYGRRYILFATVFLSVLLNLAAAFSPNYATFIVLRFFIGASSDSFMTISPILSCELVAGDLRDWFGLFSTFAWAGGYAYVGVLSIFIKEWRMLYFAVGAPGLITIFFPLIIPESPYWMLANGKWTGVEMYIKRSEKYNHVKVDLRECQLDAVDTTKAKASKRRSPIDIFKNKPMLFMLLVNGFITMGLCFYYFAISFDSRNLTEDRSTGYLLSALVELPGGLLTIPLLRSFGRQTVTVWSLFLQSIVICIPPFVKAWHWVHIGFALLCKVVNAVGLITHPLLVSELMPTTIRAISTAVINVPSCVGTMISPLLRYTDMGDGRVPAFILAGLSAAVGLCALTLPDTKGKAMPEDVDQLDPGPFYTRFLDQSSSTSSDSSESSSTTTPSSSVERVNLALGSKK